MPKVVLIYTVIREVQLDQVSSTEIEELQAEEQEKIEAAGFEVEDSSWELGEDQESADSLEVSNS